MDRYDRKIVDLLQRDASMSAAQIGERVGLSQSQCWRRIERLEQSGIIVKRTALVDRRKIGLNVMLFAQVRLTAHGHNFIEEFSQAVQNFPEVMECHILLGNADFLLRIVARDIETYQHFLLEKLAKLPMVESVNSMIAASEIKSSTALPLELVR